MSTNAVEMFAELKEKGAAAWSDVENPRRPLIIVSINTSSIASGARDTFKALSERAGSLGFDVMQTGDDGMSWAEPIVQVRKPDGQHVLYGNVMADQVQDFLKEALTDVAKGLAVGMISGSVDGVPNLRDLDWAKLQVRWLMHNCGVIDPENIDHYIGRGGYAQFLGATQTSREDLIEVVKGSTLRGHSGSFFSTGTKWSFLKDASGEPKYLVCNADEGDPGAWVNRVLMESDPHSIIEGMLIGSYATGATHGWIYLRDEYPLAYTRLTRAIEQCLKRGILGDNALGTGVSFTCEVVRGAGAYVCGDETGLISSINDERGMPRIKPPFPAQSGVLGKPTNVNNVETYACVTALLRVGDEAYSTIGTETNRGTKMFTVSGDVARTGCLEVPFGTTVTELLAAIGGIAEGRPFKALQQGGPLSGLLPGHIAGPLKLEPEPFRELGTGMGGGGLVFLDERRCVVDLNVLMAHFLEDESCGRCTTCRIGNQRMVEIFERTSRGEGRDDDVNLLRSLDASFQYSNCFHGTLSPTIMRNTLQYFADEYAIHVNEHRCPAQVCEGLIKYVVIGNSPSLAQAADLCPDHIAARGAQPDSDGRCTRGGACRDVAPDDIAVIDRFDGVIPLRAIAPADVARAG
jgi:NADH:ubiquinone oxidoreductase subunit F (NADH-binding)